MITKTFKYIPVMLIITVILCALTSLCSGVAFASFDYDSSDVTQDLESSIIDGKLFDYSDYPENKDGKLTVINVVEFAYTFSPDNMENYALYIYVYNPAKIDVAGSSSQNKLQMATAYDERGNATNFEKFDIQYCNDFKGLYYKYRVIDHVSGDGMSVAERVRLAGRKYSISGIELLTRGDRLATDYPVSRTYVYEGYAAACGEDETSESTLTCNHFELETVQLEVNQTFYRTGVSDLGYGHQNQINSVYFSVPKYITEKYGDDLYAVAATWIKARTSPILVTDSNYIYNAVTPGLNVGAHNPSVGVELVSDKSLTTGIYTSYTTDYLYSYNLDEDDKAITYIIYNRRVNPGYEYPVIYYKFRVDSLTNDRVGGTDLENYIYNYNATKNSGVFILGDYEISNDLFTAPITEDSRVYATIDNSGNYDYDLLSYEKSRSTWQAFWDSCTLLVKDLNISEEYFDVAPIIQINIDELKNPNAAQNLLIDSSDLAEVAEYVTAAGDNQTYLFRFDASDYFSIPVHEYSAPNEKAYIAQEDVYLDFDVIELTFQKNGEFNAVGVVSDPLNVIADITPPLGVEESDPPWWLAIAIIAIITITFILFISMLKRALDLDGVGLKIAFSILAFLLSAAIAIAVTFCVISGIYALLNQWKYSTACQWLWQYITSR